MNEQLSECLRLIEEKLNWGASTDWVNQDFQLLSERIFEDTRVRLSVTTLKRVWGKVNYDSAPSISTLNTLAQFLGHENWSTFKQGTQRVPAKVHRTSTKTNPKWVMVAIGLTAILLVFTLLALSKKEATAFYPEEDKASVTFKSEPVTLGLPNSVVFNYDFGKLNPDSCFIQQSWDDRLTFAVDQQGTEATAIYYYPGYFKAKLIANDQIIKEHDIHIRTKGWMATLEHRGRPRYLFEDDISFDGSLRLNEAFIKETLAPELEEPPLLTYHYFDDLGQVSGDAFQFEARFRNTYPKSNGICQFTNVLIHGKNGVLILPFSIPGCISDLSIFMIGMSIDGKSNDLSAFGTDIHNWQDLRCEVKDGQVRIHLNEQLIREFEAPESLGELVGFKFRFVGSGEIDKVRLSNLNEVTLAEEFQISP